MNMTDDSRIKLILVLIAAVALIILLAYLLNNENRKMVNRTSTKCARLRELNQSFQFAPLEQAYHYYKDCASKSQFDRQRGYDYLVAVAKEESAWIENLIFETLKNQKLYAAYIQHVSEIKPTSSKRIKSLKTLLSVDSYRAIEEKLFKAEIQNPVLSPVVVVVTTYSSAKGRNRYQKEERFEIADLKNVCSTAEKQRAYAQSRDYQRSLMTPALRYAVLKRDHFRCQICGASQKDGAILEVDHYLPVSKGGKTEMNNLRTLCWQCNRGKRDSFDPEGVN